MSVFLTVVFQPSSSAKAAELLATSGEIQTGFIGFDNFSGIDDAQKTSSEEFFSANLDGTAKTLFRRLMKKDAITKLKVCSSPPLFLVKKKLRSSTGSERIGGSS